MKHIVSIMELACMNLSEETGLDNVLFLKFFSQLFFVQDQNCCIRTSQEVSALKEIVLLINFREFSWFTSFTFTFSSIFRGLVVVHTSP